MRLATIFELLLVRVLLSESERGIGHETADGLHHGLDGEDRCRLGPGDGEESMAVRVAPEGSGTNDSWHHLHRSISL